MTRAHETRRQGRARTSLASLAVALAGCATLSGSAILGQQPSDAHAADGRWISWVEHRIDDEGLTGVALRGADGLKMGDVDGDGHVDIVSAHEDSRHLRIAFGSADPHRWKSITLAQGEEVDTIEDIALADINGDGWLDMLGACERGHLIYLQNPGGQAARSPGWRRVIPEAVRGRGSWIRVFAGDLDGDGRLEVTAANKGVVDTEASTAPRSVSLFRLAGDPLLSSSWKEIEVARVAVPLNAMPADLDRDGDLDLLIGSRNEGAAVAENLAEQRRDSLAFSVHRLQVRPGAESPVGWRAQASGFHMALGDINRDRRLDIVLSWGATWKGGRQLQTYGWLEQPARLDQPWILHTIGEMLPDAALSATLADIDGDGRLDLMAGSYSGLDIFGGGLTTAPRDRDGLDVTGDQSVGRIAWFQSPADPTKPWRRHDLVRRVRGMFDEFVPLDLDRDGDLDFVATRGNSGTFDGVFWLEQVRSPARRTVFSPARSSESRMLPSPPPDWQARYRR